MTATAPTARVSRPDLVLAICCLSVLLISMDVTIVNVALTAIQANLHTGLADLQWVIDAYTLVVASLLLFIGSMADRFGRRRIFRLGLIVFTVGSLLCSLAPNIGALIAFRAVQGIGASMLNPVALSIITTTFIEPKARARAIGLWGAVFGVGLGLGPLLGGLLTQTVGWRYIFLINVPIGLAAVVLTMLFVPESKGPRARALDPVGQSLIAGALASLTFALIEGQRMGWSSTPIVALVAASFAMIVAFVVFEPKQAEPLIDLRFFRSIPFSAANVMAVLAFGAFAGLLFVNALYLQQVRGFSALQTGLCVLPVALATLVCSPISGRMVAKFGTRPSLVIAGTAMLLSSLMLTRLTDGTAIVMLVLIYLTFGTGFGMVNPAISTVAISGMPRSQAGVAAGIASTSRQVGTALGIAVMGTVAALSRANGSDFASATHPIWWLMTASGGLILILGFVTNTPWALSTSQRVAASTPTGDR